MSIKKKNSGVAVVKPEKPLQKGWYSHGHHFTAPLLHSKSSFLLMGCEKQSHCLGLCFPHGRPKWNSWLLLAQCFLSHSSRERSSGWNLFLSLLLLNKRWIFFLKKVSKKKTLIILWWVTRWASDYEGVCWLSNQQSFQKTANILTEFDKNYLSANFAN